ncbi:unnamed protein product [Ambrosiozyma monospora]|uniref:Unnamed protein product n=1 Tax=Ambrosiozyma monospora TaxID=43982 RepID=A0ACB5SRH0_AMBMO|nr:unnamed protein product [Ambrosiozyma monospora]
MLVMGFVPTLLSFVSFFCYSVVLGKPLTAPIAFTALSIFNIIQGPILGFGGMVSWFTRAKVSLGRISSFLEEPETSKFEQLAKPISSTIADPTGIIVGFQNATLGWDKRRNTFKLKDLNVTFKVGGLNLVIGPTASGKSSLLLALLGEMNLIKGEVYFPCFTARDDLIIDPVTGLAESAAYCAQTAWLLNATIKENIVFASPFNKKRYNDVIDACGLRQDLNILEGGDETQIGEKGITLSGGQKQRVSLARALYSNSAYVLLDDCLSAVDSHTAVHIYENALSGDLMKNRTCILISHNVPLTIKQAGYVIVMSKGAVEAQGTVNELIARDIFDDDVLKSLKNSSVQTQVGSVSQTTDSRIAHDNEESESAVDTSDDDDGSKGKLITKETKSDGSVDKSVYLTYWKYYGSPVSLALIAFTFVANEAAQIGQVWWIRVWSIASSQLSDILAQASSHVSSLVNSSQIDSSWWNTPIATSVVSIFYSKAIHSPIYYVSVYCLIGLLFCTTAALRSFVNLLCGLRASKGIFEDFLSSIIGSNLRFFDSTPVGRITNRFSRDISSLDQTLSTCADNFLTALIICFTVILVIGTITPVFLLFVVFIVLAYYVVGSLYLAYSRDMKRYTSIGKSPIYQHFTETLNGVITIRAYGDEKRFLIRNLKLVDAANRPSFYADVGNLWLSFRTDLVGAIVITLAAALAVFNVGTIDSGLAGISLSFAVQFNRCAVYIMRMYASLEVNMNSMERVKEYIDNPALEAPAEIPENEPAASWPEHGAIEVSNLAIRYSPNLPRVIEDVSFEVKPGEKVGVVGRTGAGKSTIISSFFRFVDPDAGFIKIDGIDICSIGLRRLRQSLNIIPQDPTLFTGSIRTNLDMFDEYADLQLFEALRRVNLITAEDYQLLIDSNGKLEQDLENVENPNKFLKLDFEITENGGNLSQGERQLICLARSLLKSPKILLLDEATASIDYQTDALIQKTIRQEFSSTTILTIAHRLKTIIDYDKILVLDKGHVVDYDNPYKLLIKEESLFKSMCENSGEYEKLVEIAKSAHAS